MLKQFLNKAQLQALKLTQNEHWQTIVPLYLTNAFIKVDYKRQRIYTPDNDFIDLDWVNPEVIDKPTLILFHGMEGNSQSHYSRRIMYYLQELGWRGVVAHARSCSGELNQTLSCYHAGFTDDIQQVIKTIAAITPHKLFAAGVSLGGNALLKFLGENQQSAQLLSAAVVISTPFDLQETSINIEKGINKYLYQPYFMKTLLQKMQQYAAKFPEFQLRPEVKTIDDFNDQYITQMYHFKNSLDYYRSSSSIKYLKKITTPCLILQAANDPLIPRHTWPQKKDLSTTIHFIGLNHGGHAGFVGNNHNFKKALLKLPKIVVQFCNNFL